MIKIPFSAEPRHIQLSFVEKVDKLLEMNKNLHSIKTRLLNRIESNLNIDKLSKRIKNFNSLNFMSFLSELKKVNVQLSLTEQDEW